jgi:molybdopterin converting factor small subunit
MPKSKAQKEAAIEQLKTLDPQTRLEVLQEEKYSEKEIAEVLAAVREALGETEEEKEEPPIAPTLERNKPKLGNKRRYQQIQMYRNVPGGPMKDGEIIKTVTLEPDRAERLNAQSHNSQIKYKLID